MWRLKWDTPDLPAPGTPNVCRQLVYPDTLQFHAIVNAAVSEIIYESSFRDFGTATIEETTQIFKQMWIGMIGGCDKVIGEVRKSYTLEVPDGWLPIEGGTFDHADYPQMLTACPQFDNADGTFTLPDDRQLYYAYAAQNPTGDNDYVVGQAFGQRNVTLNINQIPSHTHSDGFAVGSQAGAGALQPASPLLGGTPYPLTQTGGSGSHENRPPTRAVYFWIVAR